MKLCAYCGRENDDTASQCQECGTENFKKRASVSAVEEEPESFGVTAAPEQFEPRTLSPEEREQAFVTLKTCATVVEAHALVMQLKQANIEAFLPDEALLTTVGWNVNTYGFVRVKVPTGQYDDAMEFLAASAQLATTVSESEANLIKMKRDLPLSLPMRLVMFLMAGFCPSLIIAAFICGGYRNKGYARRAEESYLMLLLGFAFWLVVGCLLLILLRHEPRRRY